MLESIRTSGYRDYVQYDKVKSDNRERETTFHWQLNFTKKPSGVYIPPETLMQIRFAECDEVPTVKMGQLLETELHGWKLLQHGQNEYDATIGVKIIDFIDQSMEYAFREMVYETDRPLDHTAKPKEEMLWDAELFQFNNQDVPIHKWIMRDCLLEEYNPPQRTFNGKKDLQGDSSAKWHAQICYEVQLNTGLIIKSGAV